MEYLRCTRSVTQRIFAIASAEKVSFLYGNLRLFQIDNFKNRSFWLGHRVVQNEPNLVWSIEVYPESKTKGIFAVASLGQT